VLIIKTQGSNIPLSLNNDFQKLLDQLEDKVIVINKLMSDNEVRNLIRVCDCYISLHRSEGFGRGMAEAMSLGRPVIATRYSGNLDFMDDSNSFLVDYDLVDVGESEYPHGSGQQWARPNEERAFEFMCKIMTDSDLRKKIEAKAQIDIRSSNGYRVVGLRIKNSLNEII
jgi:glycosyltransferase involved in cell wall biosynthesis